MVRRHLLGINVPNLQEESRPADKKRPLLGTTDHLVTLEVSFYVCVPTFGITPLAILSGSHSADSACTYDPDSQLFRDRMWSFQEHRAEISFPSLLTCCGTGSIEFSGTLGPNVLPPTSSSSLLDSAIFSRSLLSFLFFLLLLETLLFGPLLASFGLVFHFSSAAALSSSSM